jgi:hypothetical protein
MDELFERCDEDEGFDPNDEETSGTLLRHNSMAVDEDKEMNAFRDWIANGLMNRS